MCFILASDISSALKLLYRYQKADKRKHCSVASLLHFWGDLKSFSLDKLEKKHFLLNTVKRRTKAFDISIVKYL